jgi:hypothetical protein
LSTPKRVRRARGLGGQRLEHARRARLQRGAVGRERHGLGGLRLLGGGCSGRRGGFARALAGDERDEGQSCDEADHSISLPDS